MNTQQLFDTCVDHLFKQRTRSFDYENDRCAYHQTDGSKCAIGALISDDHYSGNLEGRSIMSDPESGRPSPRAAVEGSIGRSLDPAEIDILNQVQHAHDDANEEYDDDAEAYMYSPLHYDLDGVIDVTSMNHALRGIAGTYGLQYHDRT